MHMLSVKNCVILSINNPARASRSLNQRNTVDKIIHKGSDDATKCNQRERDAKRRAESQHSHPPMGVFANDSQ